MIKLVPYILGSPEPADNSGSLAAELPVCSCFKGLDWICGKLGLSTLAKWRLDGARLIITVEAGEIDDLAASVLF